MHRTVQNIVENAWRKVVSDSSASPQALEASLGSFTGALVAYSKFSDDIGQKLQLLSSPIFFPKIIEIGNQHCANPIIVMGLCTICESVMPTVVGRLDASTSTALVSMLVNCLKQTHSLNESPPLKIIAVLQQLFDLFPVTQELSELIKIPQIKKLWIEKIHARTTDQMVKYDWKYIFGVFSLFAKTTAFDWLIDDSSTIHDVCEIILQLSAPNESEKEKDEKFKQSLITLRAFIFIFLVSSESSHFPFIKQLCFRPIIYNIFVRGLQNILLIPTEERELMSPYVNMFIGCSFTSFFAVLSRCDCDETSSSARFIAPNSLATAEVRDLVLKIVGQVDPKDGDSAISDLNSLLTLISNLMVDEDFPPAWAHKKVGDALVKAINSICIALPSEKQISDPEVSDNVLAFDFSTVIVRIYSAILNNEGPKSEQIASRIGIFIVPALRNSIAKLLRVCADQFGKQSEKFISHRICFLLQIIELPILVTTKVISNKQCNNEREFETVKAAAQVFQDGGVYQCILTLVNRLSSQALADHVYIKTISILCMFNSRAKKFFNCEAVAKLLRKPNEMGDNITSFVLSGATLFLGLLNRFDPFHLQNKIESDDDFMLLSQTAVQVSSSLQKSFDTLVSTQVAMVRAVESLRFMVRRPEYMILMVMFFSATKVFLFLTPICNSVNSPSLLLLQFNNDAFRQQLMGQCQLCFIKTLRFAENQDQFGVLSAVEGVTDLLLVVNGVHRKTLPKNESPTSWIGKKLALDFFSVLKSFEILKGENPLQNIWHCEIDAVLESLGRGRAEKFKELLGASLSRFRLELLGDDKQQQQPSPKYRRLRYLLTQHGFFIEEVELLLVYNLLARKISSRSSSTSSSQFRDCIELLLRRLPHFSSPVVRFVSTLAADSECDIDSDFNLKVFFDSFPATGSRVVKLLATRPFFSGREKVGELMRDKASFLPAVEKSIMLYIPDCKHCVDLTLFRFVDEVDCELRRSVYSERQMEQFLQDKQAGLHDREVYVHDLNYDDAATLDKKFQMHNEYRWLAGHKEKTKLLLMLE